MSKIVKGKEIIVSCTWDCAKMRLNNFKDACLMEENYFLSLGFWFANFIFVVRISGICYKGRKFPRFEKKWN